MNINKKIALLTSMCLSMSLVLYGCGNSHDDDEDDYEDKTAILRFLESSSSSSNDSSVSSGTDSKADPSSVLSNDSDSKDDTKTERKKTDEIPRQYRPESEKNRATSMATTVYADGTSKTVSSDSYYGVEEDKEDEEEKVPDEFKVYRKGVFNRKSSFEFYDGPLDFEGASIKFSVPSGLVFTLKDYTEIHRTYSNEKYYIPVLYTKDVIDIDHWPAALDGEYNFRPYLLQQKDISYDDVDESVCEDLISHEFTIIEHDELVYGKKYNYKHNDPTFEVKDHYKLYTVDFYNTYDNTETFMVYCIMDNGSVISAEIKKGSDYEKTYLKDLEKIANTFDYSDVSNIP